MKICSALPILSVLGLYSVSAGSVFADFHLLMALQSRIRIIARVVTFIATLVPLSVSLLNLFLILVTRANFAII